MVEGHVDDVMIEIGDPSDETKVVEPPPRVVIEYRDRGVPWMLIPPLLVLSAVIAVFVTPKLAPPAPSLPLVQTNPAEVTVATPPAEVAVTPPRAEVAIASAPAAASGIPPEDELLPPPIQALLIPIEPTQTLDVGLAANPEPAPFPRVPGLGFDPKALEADRNVEAPVDPAIAPVAQERRENAGQIDVELLPPDPRQARARHLQRLVEAKKQADADRVQFHEELRAICQKSKLKGVPQILQLCKRYPSDLDPAIKQKAMRMLGQNGDFVGASQSVRIKLLRSIGFPESAILDDLCFQVGQYESSAARGGLTFSEKIYHSSLFLLNNPPARAATTARPASSTRSEVGNRAAPSEPASLPNPIQIPGPVR